MPSKLICLTQFREHSLICPAPRKKLLNKYDFSSKQNKLFAGFNNATNQFAFFYPKQKTPERIGLLMKSKMMNMGAVFHNSIKLSRK